MAAGMRCQAKTREVLKRVGTAVAAGAMLTLLGQ